VLSHLEHPNPLVQSAALEAVFNYSYFSRELPGLLGTGGAAAMVRFVWLSGFVKHVRSRT
jgi:hypothetical protein